MPEAAKVEFVAMSLAFVVVSILLLVMSVSITVLLLVTVEARLSMLLPSIYMKVANWGGIVVYFAPAGRMVTGRVGYAVDVSGGVCGAKVVAAVVARYAGNVFEGNLGNHEDFLRF